MYEIEYFIIFNLEMLYMLHATVKLVCIQYISYLKFKKLNCHYIRIIFNLHLTNLLNIIFHSL